MNGQIVSPTASSRSSKSARQSTFSRSSRKSAQTDCSSYRSQPSLKHKLSVPDDESGPAVQSGVLEGGDVAKASASSVDTYASTRASNDDLPLLSQDGFPRERKRILEPDSSPSSSECFARLFPTTRRMMVQHDDSTSDGNVNLRLDTDAVTQAGRRVKVSLFHLKMQDIGERKFSLRRYWRGSGREVCSCRRKYVKPVPPKCRPSQTDYPPIPTEPAARKHLASSQEDVESDSDDDELAESNKINATVRTDAMTLEFSNYAQVVLTPRSTDHRKQYDFEYWGEYYSWKRRPVRDGGEIIIAYELINLRTNRKVSSITPDALNQEVTEFEASQGAWIPACSMRIQEQNISDDLGDVVIATGLIALTDDCIPRSTHLASHSAQIAPDDR